MNWRSAKSFEKSQYKSRSKGRLLRGEKPNRVLYCIINKSLETLMLQGFQEVEVAGFEPAAFWFRTPVVSFEIINYCPVFPKLFACV